MASRVLVQTLRTSRMGQRSLVKRGRARLVLSCLALSRLSCLALFLPSSLSLSCLAMSSPRVFIVSFVLSRLVFILPSCGRGWWVDLSSQ
jgi:hypothetical protein